MLRHGLLLLFVAVAAVAWQMAPLPPVLIAPDEQPKEQPTDAVTEFRARVEPPLTKYCLECHSGAEPKGELSLEGYVKRGTLVEDRKLWEKVSEKLHTGEMPPEERPQPAAGEREAIVGWIDAGLAKVDCGSERDPGRVTIRRLNRNEYNNTIRDLVGIDFHPADDFPSDDVGYGFDNIGDVLSMQPILLEKYLAAAQKVVELALGTEQANLATGEVTGGALWDGGRRVLPSAGDVRTKLKPFGKGDYILRVRAFGDQAGPEPVKMAMYVDDKLVRSFEVKAVAARPEVYEAWVPMQGGGHTYSVAFLNDFYDPTTTPPRDRNLYVSDLEVMGPYPNTYRQIIPREHTPEDRAVLEREIIGGFMSLAFRRPSPPAEVDRVLKLVAMAAADGENFAASIGLGVQAILVSPHFLFRVEMDPEPNNPRSVRTISDHELATRLSYFLWSSMPDDELAEMARQGLLRQGDTLARQVRRMLADPKSRALVDNFAGQWLQLRNLKIASPDKQVYPQFDEPLRAAMLRETELFFSAVVSEDRSVLDFIDADFTFVNERLAKHYGIPDVTGGEFRKVQLSGDERGGVLTHASVLTVTSNPTRTSPVKRGKWVLDNILGAPPPPPPATVPPLNEETADVAGASLRERMEQHRANPDCAVCHNRMDPLGFGLENYDGIGSWRAADGKFKIDPAGTLSGGKSFASPRELKAILKGRPDEFVRCLAEKLLTYGLGRGIEYSDRCAVAEIALAMRQNDYKFSSCIIAIVSSESFQKRRGRGTEP